MKSLAKSSALKLAVAVVIGAVVTFWFTRNTGGERIRNPLIRVHVLHETNLQRPLLKHLPDLNQLERIVMKEASAVTDCIRLLGQAGTYSLRDSGDELHAYLEAMLRDNTQKNDTWGSFDPEKVHSTGYRTSGSAPTEIHVGDYGNDQDLVERCFKSVDAQLPYGQSAFSFGSVSSLPENGPTNAIQDERLKQPLKHWRDCMREIGFEYASPAEAAANPRWRTSGSVSLLEIRTAEADTGCKLSTDLLDSALAIQLDIDKEYEQTHGLELVRFDQSLETFSIGR